MGGTGPVPVAPGSARRWNGWGDPAVVATLSPHASAVLTELVGPARPAEEHAGQYSEPHQPMVEEHGH